MADELTLTPEEQAFFTSGGAAEPPVAETPPASPAAETAAIAPEAAGEPVATEPKQTMVPHAALHEERERRKELQRELEQQRNWQQQAEQRLQALYQHASQQQQAQQPAPPTWDDAPVDAAKYGLQVTQQQLQNLGQTVEQLRNEKQAEEVLSRMNNAVAAQEQAFVGKNADYHDAVRHLLQIRTDIYRDFGAPEEQIPQLLENERRQILVRAAQIGKTVPELVYAQAKRMGYQPKAAGAKQPDRIAQLQAGQQAAVTVGNLPGTPGQQVTLESLVNMPDDEFAALLAKSPKMFRRVQEGR